MHSDLLKRLMRAISEGKQSDLYKVGQAIVEHELKSGHSRLSSELLEILTTPSRARRSNTDNYDSNKFQLKELPSSKRNGNLLATFIDRDSLEHFMVLPSETEIRFARIEAEYSARERLSRHGLGYRRSILLHGPPGCGKSLGAKRLAWNTGLPLIKVRFDALISSFFGESATNLRSVFEMASETPCVLLFDECDFLARSRNNTKDIGEASRIVNSLLQLMEEFDGQGLLVATTNLESALDPAIFRRFDDAFEVPPPGKSEIVKLLKMSLSSIQCSKDINWDKLGPLLGNRSASDVVKIAKNAAKSIILSGKTLVTMESLVSAISDSPRE